MAIFNSITTFLTWLITGLGVLGSLLYLILKRSLEKSVDARFDERLENVKHQLQLEQQRMSVVYENQKDSFRKVLIAMHDATHAIEKQIQGVGGDWLPIARKDVNQLLRVSSEEALFMDDISVHALKIYGEIMWTAVADEDDTPDTDIVWRAYNQMKFISDRLAAHFRNRVGLETTASDPVLDVEILGACRLINRFHFYRTESILKFKKNGKASEYVALSRKSPDVLKSELHKLKDALASRASGYFEILTEVNRYLAEFADLKAVE